MNLNRIMTVRIQSKPVNITYVQVYAPTSPTDKKDTEAFYELLAKTLKDVKSRDMVVITGDFNANVGFRQHLGEKDLIGTRGIGDRNANGDMLVDFAITNDRKITNTFYQHHPRRLYTWISPDGNTRNQIDY